MSCVERENAVYELWKSERYETKREIARKIGVGHTVIDKLIRAKEDRKRLSLRDSIITTRDLVSTEGLPDEERKAILTAVEKGKLQAQNVDDVVRAIKEAKDQKR